MLQRMFGLRRQEGVGTVDLFTVRAAVRAGTVGRGGIYISGPGMLLRHSLGRPRGAL